MSIHSTVIGNLTNDPVKKKVRVAGEPRDIVEFRVFSDVYKTVNDELVQDDDKCTGVDVTIWLERLGDQVHKLLRKGARVRVSGDMILNRYEDQESGQARAGLRMTADSCDLVLTRIESIQFKASRSQREPEQAPA